MTDSNPLGDLSPQEAWDLFQSDHRAVLVDIRSSMEFLFVGHPTGAVHVAWIDEPDWLVNPNFVKEIRQLMLGGISTEEGETTAPIILICRSGKRSKEAGKALLAAGVENVHHVNEGFEGELDDQHRRSTLGGWRYHQLPWEQC